MLKERVADMEYELQELRTRVLQLEKGSTSPPAARPRIDTPARPAAPAALKQPEPPAISLEDFLGGRLLGWVGGAAVFVGLALLFTLAIAHGWITEGMRSAIGAAFSATLVAGGVRLHGKHGRTHASLALVGTGIAGLFMSIAVATSLYDLVPVGLGLPAAAGVGALGTWLAVRWGAEVIAWLGVLGALGTPLMTGLETNSTRTAFVAIALAAASGVLIMRRWTRLALAAFALAAFQWVPFVLDGRPATPAILLTLAVFGALHLALALGADLREQTSGLSRSAVLLLCLNAAALTAAGWIALVENDAPITARMLLAGLAAAHLTVGLWGRTAPRISNELAVVCLGLGAILANLAFASVTHGVVQGLGWAAGAAAIAYLARRGAPRELEDTVLALGLGGHTALALGQALIAAPPDQLAATPAGAGGVVLLIGVAASCLASAQLVGSQRPGWSSMANAAGLLTVAYLTAASLHGLALVAAFVVECVALDAVARRHDDAGARIATVVSLGFAALAALSLGSHQQGRLQMTAIWALLGIAALFTGLHRDTRDLRLAGFALLGLATGKAFVVDTANLTAGYRISSLIGLGLLLLASAFAYQRVRPEPPADLREVPDALR